MHFDYFDMLSGEPIYINQIGYFRSPQLKELAPGRGIGYQEYNIYLHLLSWNKEQLLQYKTMSKYADDERLKREHVTAYDIITLTLEMRELYGRVLSFFMLSNERLSWDEKHRSFIVQILQNDESFQQIGVIDRSNFDELREAILQLNFVGIDKETSPVQHSSDAAKELWERAQNYLKEQSQKNSGEAKPEYHLSNIVSKICAVHPSYNLLNIFDLTIFQLYDSFFQIGYMRSSDLNEQIFSNHGGEKFRFEDWLKPIFKKI